MQPRTIAMIAGGVLWCVLVFVVTFYVTFPSDTLVRQAQYRTPELLGREYSLEVGSISPALVGLTAADVKLFHTPRTSWREDEAPAKTIAGLAKDLRVKISPLASLFASAPQVYGSVTFTESPITYAVGTAVDKRGNLALTSLDVASDDLPLADLLMLIPELTASASGKIDVDLEIEAGEEGMADANGSVDIEGGTLVLSDVEIPGIGPLGMDIPVSALRIVGEVQDGELTIERGIAQSDLLEIEIEGTITLRDPLDRSTVDVQITLSNLGDDLAAFEGFLASAKGSDGDYHFNCRGMISRLRGCTAERTASRSRPSRPRAATRRPSSSADRPTAERSSSARSPRERTELDAERERRREEIRERLRQRREERERLRDPNDDVEEFDEDLDEPEFAEDEEFLDDEELEEEFDDEDRELEAFDD